MGAALSLLEDIVLYTWWRHLPLVLFSPVKDKNNKTVHRYYMTKIPWRILESLIETTRLFKNMTHLLGTTAKWDGKDLARQHGDCRFGRP